MKFRLSYLHGLTVMLFLAALCCYFVSAKTEGWIFFALGATTELLAWVTICFWDNSNETDA